ncbi:MAG: adenylyl-sulfate kinase [Leptospiraceae bacterium]|nr:adenylyl-sulfate kinase [Leptospiraceae bacterium]
MNQRVYLYSIIDKGYVIEIQFLFLEEIMTSKNNVVWQDLEITREDFGNIIGHNSAVLWLTGLSGSGKSTIAKKLQKKLVSENKMAYVLDGDNVRHGLNQDLGFTEEDRIENIRRISEVAKLLMEAGIIVITAFISPYQKERRRVREKLGHDFVEVYVKCPLEECEKRDPKGLYKKARKGEIPDFTGISSPYEEPENPEIVVDTSNANINQEVTMIYEYLEKKEII